MRAWMANYASFVVHDAAPGGGAAATQLRLCVFQCAAWQARLQYGVSLQRAHF
jgi:hypothetical protein